MKNELRIGNYIQRNDLGDGHKRVERILELGEMTCTTTGPVKVICGYLFDISGVPLSEEWLIKAGFEVGENSSWYEKGVLGISKSGSIAFHLEGKWCNYGSIKLEFVHEIQNLWHSLTGEELEFKL